MAHRPPLYLEVHELHLIKRWITVSLRASSPIWASETSLANLSSAPRSSVLARLTSLPQIGELVRRLDNGVNRSLNKTLSGGIAQLISQIRIRGTVHGPIQRRLKKKRARIIKLQPTRFLGSVTSLPSQHVLNHYNGHLSSILDVLHSYCNTLTRATFRLPHTCPSVLAFRRIQLMRTSCGKCSSLPSTVRSVFKFHNFNKRFFQREKNA